MSSLLVRQAQEGDNQQLLKLTRNCPVLGPISFYQKRESRFLPPMRSQGSPTRFMWVSWSAKLWGPSPVP